MNVRVVVADERQANFFDTVRSDGPLAARGTVENPTGGMKDRELETDRAGSRFGGTSGVTHGSGPAAGHHHGVDGERSTERHELALFAKNVAQRIDAGRINHEFDKVILIAGPRMLGLLRQELPQTCKDLVAGEVSKDLVQHEPDVILKAVPPEVFFH